MLTRILCLLCCLWSTAPYADLLPPQAAGMAERYTSNPGAFDRSDAWCEEHRVGERCEIPGTTFEGGGTGLCGRFVHRTDYQIDLLCALKPQPRIEYGFPDGPWQADTQLCELASHSESTAESLRSQGWVCAEPPAVADRFCKGMMAGQACVAEITLESRSERFDGFCKLQIETQRSYYQGRRTLTRSTLQCSPERTIPPTALKPVSAWRKLFQ